MNAERIVKRTLADRKKDKTDWARLRAMTEAEIERGAENDPDNPPWTQAELRNAQLVLPSGDVKVPLSIRLDREVIDYFKSQGTGYQSRIGAVLLSYVRTREGERQSKRATRPRVTKRVAPAKKTQTTTKRAAAKKKKPTGSKK
jgi:uncharacterized protein (DUF4415 family)